MAPPAPGRLTTKTLTPRRFDMPSASRRALTSADEPAGNSTVISIGCPPGNGLADAAVARPAAAASAIARVIRRVLTELMRCSIRSAVWANFRALLQRRRCHLVE